MVKSFFSDYTVFIGTYVHIPWAHCVLLNFSSHLASNFFKMLTVLSPGNESGVIAYYGWERVRSNSHIGVLLI
jgi:hypothetical protein